MFSMYSLAASAFLLDCSLGISASLFMFVAFASMHLMQGGFASQACSVPVCDSHKFFARSLLGYHELRLIRVS